MKLRRLRWKKRWAWLLSRSLIVKKKRLSQKRLNLRKLKQKSQHQKRRKKIHRKDPEFRRKESERSCRYAKTPKGKAARKKWKDSPKGRESRRRQAIMRQKGETPDDYAERIIGSMPNCEDWI